MSVPIGIYIILTALAAIICAVEFVFFVLDWQRNREERESVSIEKKLAVLRIEEEEGISLAEAVTNTPVIKGDKI